MYDYLFSFPDEATAKAALPDWLDADGNWTPKTHCGVLPTSIIMQEATYDEEGNQLTPRVDVPGYWLVISTSEVDDDLYALAVQESLAPVVPTYYRDCITRTKLGDDDYAAFIQPDPVWAGSDYLWGQP